MCSVGGLLAGCYLCLAGRIPLGFGHKAFGSRQACRAVMRLSAAIQDRKVSRRMPLLGAHMSVAGGLYKAVEAAADLGMDTVQIFTHSPSQWAVPAPSTEVRSENETTMRDLLNPVPGAKTVSREEASRFQDVVQTRKITAPIAHASYLINLATPDAQLWQRSVDALTAELHRAAQLGIAWVVVHPGSFTTATEADGIAHVVRALDQIRQRTGGKAAGCLLETTAGQGTNLGWRFEQLGQMLSGVQDATWLGVCLDTCHLFAAGYALAPQSAYEATMQEMEHEIGLARVQAIHLNDSQKEQGSRVDRHAHLGQGHLGLEPFRLLLNDQRFAALPMYLETPKGKNDAGELWDAVNLAILRSLVRRKKAAKP